ncbi:sugar phosphate nucleotidyltransferase [Polaribacter sp. AHE13PA]|uniref:nucleotidyltransferase family protein n=1 Tax=Polaribacter sp. AHE13PA TaxID=2745562 RepID=UPI001C4E9AC4|nr:sugar phosphate nucleotidyltransferase [Polaribacter sp. AHE13PA]QXP66404.1 nucleotide-diphospho-sugar transferase [Polaribacter sp. AHE13PA]
MSEKNKPTLVILAAGMGSRYGGLKQMDSFTKEGDTIIDFSLYDAVHAGFGKVVFIIRKTFEKEFKNIYNTKLAGKIAVEYVFQELENVPEKYRNPKRVKPWGTGHALLMTKNVIKENFAIINADDFYSRQAFVAIAEQLRNTDKNSYDFSMVAYSLKNTISENGYVSRGECTVDENGFLTDVTERVRIEKIVGILKSEDDNGEMVPIDENTTVSMNFWGFTPKCFEFGDALFLDFLGKTKENLKAEFYLPTIVNTMLASKKASVKVLESDSKWFGVTYSDDKKKAQLEINKLKESGVYPNKLWN